MNKEQFLAMSLPHGVFFHSEMDDVEDIPLSGEIWEMVGLTPLFGDLCADTKNNDAYPIHTIKPILHPLSDLTKEIEHKGERFSSIIRLSEMEEIKDIKSFEKFIFSMIEDYFHLPFLFVQQLIEWHFDLFGWIDSGEAIDVNSLSENPYK